MENQQAWTYRQAGVDIKRGQEAVNLFKPLAAQTMRPEVLGTWGGFASFFALDVEKYQQPVLVSGTDGVGTKLALAQQLNKHDSIGIDCVAMCVNDILVTGAQPLFFLDYIAVGKLEPKQVAAIVKGIALGCREAGCALIGGETAEMPGFYAPGKYDLAGFVVGVVEKEKIISGANIKPGDLVLGLASNGLHSNGFSLVRKIFLDVQGRSLEEYLPELGCTLGEELLKPTRIYVNLINSILERFTIKGMAHITGGGLVENIPRILPPNCQVEIKSNSWPWPPIFKLLAEGGNLATEELLNTFNLGIGYVLILEEAQARNLQAWLKEQGEVAYLLGEVTQGSGGLILRGEVK